MKLLEVTLVGDLLGEDDNDIIKINNKN